MTLVKMPPKRRLLCFVPDANSPGKRDVDGAFFPEALAFIRFHGAITADALRRFPAHAPLAARRTACAQAVRATPDPIDVFAFFCHGWRVGLQAGFQRTTTLSLARLVAQHGALDAHVVLYACDTGRDADADAQDDRDAGPGGDGGFADELRDACETLGRRVTVTGHTTAGHCSWNPYARYFAPQRGGVGGDWFVEPNSELWPAWRRALRDPRNTLRFRFWSMTPDEIADELGGGSDRGPLVA